MVKNETLDFTILILPSAEANDNPGRKNSKPAVAMGILHQTAHVKTAASVHAQIVFITAVIVCISAMPLY